MVVVVVFFFFDYLVTLLGLFCWLYITHHITLIAVSLIQWSQQQHYTEQVNILEMFRNLQLSY